MELELNIPEGYQAVMPYLLIKESEAFLEFLKKAFDGKEKMKVMNQEGTNIMHAEVIVAGHCIMFGSCEKAPEEPSRLSISVPNVDEIYKKGLEAGATSIMEPGNFGWGQFGGFKDQFGNTWWIVETQKAEPKKEQPALRPYFSLKDAGPFLDFLKKVFDAEETRRMNFPNTEKVMHAETLVAGNLIMVGACTDDWECISGGVSVSIANVDEVYKTAIAEGATSLMEPTDFPWGKFSGWKDPFGNTWWVVSQQSDATENVNPYISPKDCGAFIEFMKKVFNAEEKMKNLTPEGLVSFCELRTLGTVLICSEGSEEKGYISSGIRVSVKNADEIYKKAMEAGATSKMEPQDMPFGRFCCFKDSFGNTWLINQGPKEEKKLQANEKGQGVWPYFAVKNAAGFLEFLKKVFHAEETTRKFGEDGKTIMHAETNISGGTIMCSEGSEQCGYGNGGAFVYVPDADETHKVALAEGATEINPPADHTYGRSSGVKDPFGNTFWITSAPQKCEGKNN